MPRIEPTTAAYYVAAPTHPPLPYELSGQPPPPLGMPPPDEPTERVHHSHVGGATIAQADKDFRRMRAALNASEGNWVDRIFAGWRVRWRVHRLRLRLRQLGVHSGDLPPLRKAFVRKKVPIEITDVAWHEQLRLWWWPPGLSPNIDT